MISQDIPENSSTQTGVVEFRKTRHFQRFIYQLERSQTELFKKISTRTESSVRILDLNDDEIQSLRPVVRRTNGSLILSRDGARL